MSLVINAGREYMVLEQQIGTVVTGPLFTTDAKNLSAEFGPFLPQDYNCNACKRFVDTYGGLVTVDHHGLKSPVFWHPESVPVFFKPFVRALYDEVKRAKIRTVFYSEKPILGVPANVSKSGITWTHMHGIVENVVQDAGPKMAEKRQDYIMLRKVLKKYRREHVEWAAKILGSDALPRNDIGLRIAEWMLRIYDYHSDMLWREVALAPPGFCHINNIMLGTLLEDLSSGLDIEAVKRRWTEKLHPLQYRRPTAIKEGTIEVANKLIEKLGVAASLKRRFATFGEVPLIWIPTNESKPQAAGGIFDHLKQSKSPVVNMALPAQKMTFAKFRETVLPAAKKLEYKIRATADTFYGFVTAVDAAAPLLFQWNNPFSWYQYYMGSACDQWGLLPGWKTIDGIMASPAGKDDRLFFIMKDAHDSGLVAGGGFFPEMLRNEYHAIRSGMEAYAKTAKIEGIGSANGLCIEKGFQCGYEFRVDGTDIYVLDRWD